VAPTTSSTASSTSTSIPNSSNSQSDNIALGVGIGIGIPALVVAFCAWWFPRHPHRNRIASHPTTDIGRNKSGVYMDPGSESHPSERSGRLGRERSNGVEEQTIVTNGELSSHIQTTVVPEEHIERLN
jgi:hypothetical protein